MFVAHLLSYIMLLYLSLSNLFVTVKVMAMRNNLVKVHNYNMYAQDLNNTYESIDRVKVLLDDSKSQKPQDEGGQNEIK